VGNKTCALWFVLLIGSVLAPSGAGWSQDAHIGGPVLMVAVYDDAGVGHEIVQRAEAQAGRLFGEAGVAVSWRNPRWEVFLPEADGQKRFLHVHIVRRPHALAEDVFGTAFIDEEGHGRQADIFYDRIANLSTRGAQDRAVLLGAVMAHEVGHLLLGPHAHAPAGIMCGRWDADKLQLAIVGLAGFNAEQAMRMRQRIAQPAFSATMREVKPKGSVGIQPSAFSPEGAVLRAAQ
jgi:hypothetical protein